MIRDKIQDSIRQCLKQDSPINLEVPKDAANGDFSTNAAFLLAKQMKKPPRVIAEQLVANITQLDKEKACIERVEVAGAGFINFYMKKGYLLPVLKEIESDDYGKSQYGQGKKIMVEFVSANPTGPMHMGNARGGAVGDVLANVLSWAGFDVTREFYLNDAGSQIDKLGKSLDARYMQTIDPSYPFPEDGYMGEDIKDHAQSYIQQFGEILSQQEQCERIGKLTEYALSKNISAIKQCMSDYGINFDAYFKESQLHEEGEVDKTIEILKAGDLTYEEDGALYFKSTQFGSEKDDVLIRQTQFPTYFAVDIAYHKNKFITRGFHEVINIWGADHHGHVARMKGAMSAIGVDEDRLTVIIIQLVNLMEDGSVVRMSKRTGRMITLQDLIHEIGKDAARVFFNMRQAGAHMDFDLNQAKENTNENPVFYIKYAHARICSIIANIGETVKPYEQINTKKLVSDEELQVIECLARFPEEIVRTARLKEPSFITRYAIELAACFHSFYSACRVKCDDNELMHARLKLCDSVRRVLRSACLIIGIEAPEKM